VRADARGRTGAGMVNPLPWARRFGSYERRDSMHIPLAGKVAWILAEGRKPYWRGRITKLTYEFAR